MATFSRHRLFSSPTGRLNRRLLLSTVPPARQPRNPGINHQNPGILFREYVERIGDQVKRLWRYWRERLVWPVPSCPAPARAAFSELRR